MYTGLQHLHSYLAYLLLAGLVISIIYAVISYTGKKPFTDKTRKMGLLGLVSTHLQFVIGLVLYFVSPLGVQNFSGDNMKDATARLYMLEHPLTMLIAVALITIGYSRSKRLTDDGKRYKSIIIFYSLGLLLILIRIPWQAWP